MSRDFDPPKRPLDFPPLVYLKRVQTGIPAHCSTPATRVLRKQEIGGAGSQQAVFCITEIIFSQHGSAGRAVGKIPERRHAGGGV